MKDNLGYPNMLGAPRAVGHPGPIGSPGPPVESPPEYFCPKHGNIKSWVFQFANKDLNGYFHWYCPYCLQELAIEHPDMNVSERVKLLDPVYPWTDELTKEDFEELEISPPSLNN